MSPRKTIKLNKKPKELHFEQEKCDGITKKYVTKSKKIVDNKKDIPEVKHIMDLANDAIFSKNYVDAFDYLNQIIEKYSYFDAYNKKGFLLLEIGDNDGAIDCFNKSIELTKNNYDAHIGKVRAYNNLLEENYDLFYELELFSNLNIACILNPKDILLKINILIDFGMIKEAKECFETLPNDLISEDNLENHLLYVFQLGRIYYYFKRYKFAFYLFYYYATLDENNITVWLFLVFLSKNLEKYDYALKCYDKLFELDDTFYDALLQKAELLVKLHRTEEAMECFNRCPDEYISEDYKKLIEFINNPHYIGTKYLGVYLLQYEDSPDFEYVFIDMDNGFSEIYDSNSNDLEYAVRNSYYFKEIKYHGDFLTRDYITCYYQFPNLNFGYKELIFSILNNENLEKIDKCKLSVDDFLINKNDTEKKIIKSLFSSMKSSLKYAHKKNYTGIFGVLPSKHSGLWVYVDLVKAKYLGWDTIYAESLEELEILVKSSGSFWYIFDEDLKNESEEEFNNSNS